LKARTLPLGNKTGTSCRSRREEQKSGEGTGMTLFACGEPIPQNLLFSTLYWESVCRKTSKPKSGKIPSRNLSWPL